MPLSPLKRKLEMVEIYADSSTSLLRATLNDGEERQLSAAEAWAKKRADQIKKAAEMRAARTTGQPFGASSGLDFLDRLGAAERRDERKSKDDVADSHTGGAGSFGPPPKPLPVPQTLKAPVPKAAKKKPGKKKERTSKESVHQKKKKKTAAQMEAQKKATKASACDPGRELEKHGYEQLGPIAAGAFSTILRARNPETGAEVAVKTFDNAKCGKAKQLADARDGELAALRLLARHAFDSSSVGVSGRHPHIAYMLAEHEGPNASHAVLEYCNGGSLQRHLQLLQKTRAPKFGAGGGSAAGSSNDAIGMPEVPASIIMYQIASALDYLHTMEMAHRDLKPGNILFVGPNGANEFILHVKLCDFGFAIKCGQRRLRKQVGTPQFVAPELTVPPDANGTGYLGRPVDMWALGAVLYNTIHGKHAFHGASFEQLETRIRAVSHEPFGPQVSSHAKSLVKGLLVHDPERRLTSSAAIAHPFLQMGKRESEAQQRGERPQQPAQRVDSGRSASGKGSRGGSPAPNRNRSPAPNRVDRWFAGSPVQIS